MADISSLTNLTTRQQTPVDQVVEAFRRTRQEPVNRLNAQKQEIDRRSNVFTQFNSRLESLLSSVDNYASLEDSLKKVTTKSTTSSNTNVVTVSASENALNGDNSIRVNRLATADTLVSNRVALSDPSTLGVGTKNFDITIGGETVNVSVEFDGTESQEDAMKKVVSAINDSENIGVRASFIRDTSSTGRISLLSSGLGEDNQITFSDPDNVLSAFGITNGLNADSENRTVFSDTNAGFRSANVSELNSEAEVNGITVVRSSNSLNDVFDGVSITLQAVQEADEAAVTISTTTDVNSVKNDISGLLNSYNETLAFFGNANSQDRFLRQDPTLRNFRTELRRLGSQDFTGELKYLSDIGVQFDTNTGSLLVRDDDVLQSAIEKNPENVAEMLSEFAQRLKTLTENFTGSDGVVQGRRDSLQEQSQNIDTRIESLESRIDRQAEAYRREYERLLLNFSEAQNQFNSLSAAF